MYYSKGVETEFEKDSDREDSSEISDENFWAALLETAADHSDVDEEAEP